MNQLQRLVMLKYAFSISIAPQLHQILWVDSGYYFSLTGASFL